jgi:hypothetical protein
MTPNAIVTAWCESAFAENPRPRQPFTEAAGTAELLTRWEVKALAELPDDVVVAAQ